MLPLDLAGWIQTENCYRAAHHGLDADFIYNDRGELRPLSGLVNDLIDFCQPVARDLGERNSLELTRRLLRGRPGYARQLQVYSESRSTRAVTENLNRQLLEQEQPLSSAA